MSDKWLARPELNRLAFSRFAAAQAVVILVLRLTRGIRVVLDARQYRLLSR